MMPGKTAAVILLLSCLVSSYGSAQVAAEYPEVMTYNIRYDNPGDGIYSWKERKQAVFSLIRSEDPAIAGLQEVLEGQLKGLLEALPGYGYAGVGRDDGISGGEFSPILFKKSLFTIEKSSTFWLSETPSVPGSISWQAACTRIVTWAKLRNKTSGAAFFCFNTHFDHVSETARMNSARMLIDSIRSIAGTAPVILTGDFNCTSYDPALEAISAVMTDCRTDAALDAGFPTTFVGFPADTTRREVIDHIFISRNNWPRVRKYAVMLNQTDGKYPSDHLPVTVELQFPANPDQHNQ